MDVAKRVCTKLLSYEDDRHLPKFSAHFISRE